MAQELITLSGYRTGGVETLARIRSRVAFDLTHLDLHNRRMIAASLQIGPGAAAGRTCDVRLSDPAGECDYGRADGVAADGRLHVPLTGDAIADLIEASGAYFAVSAEIEDAAGEPQRLPSGGTAQVLVLTVAEAVQRAAA